jgi:hypothetical protein
VRRKDKRKLGDEFEGMIEQRGKAIRDQMRGRDGVRTGLIESRVKSNLAHTSNH